MAELVVGYDGSDCSRAAFAKAAELAKELGDSLVIVFGYAPPGFWGGEIVAHEEAIEELGERVVAEAKEQAAAAGVEATVEMVAKEGAAALVDIASERDARMIVVGSYGEKPLKGMILGSTAYKLLYTAERPVLVVPEPG
jgi:nucleotide-binding universal stress UspA family protein